MFQQIGFPALVCLQGSPRDADNFGLQLQIEGLTVGLLRGPRMRTTESLFNEFAAVLQFPYYFGKNWAAFDECLTDFRWSPPQSYVLIITDALHVLQIEQSEQLGIFLKNLRKANESWGEEVAVGEWWDRPPVPFHVGFQETSENFDELVARLTDAGADPVRLALPGQDAAA